MQRWCWNAPTSSKTVSDSLSYTFVDADGNEVISDEIHCSVDKIGVMMTVSMVKEIPLTVQLIDGGGATGEHTVSSIEPATITVKGSAEDLEGMNSLNIGNVDLSTVPTNTAFTKSYNIVLPDNMTNMTGEETAEVTVELKNLKEKTFRVTNLELANTPSNLKATLGDCVLADQSPGSLRRNGGSNGQQHPCGGRSQLGGNLHRTVQRPG